MLVIPMYVKLRQEDHLKSEDCLSYRIRCCVQESHLKKLCYLNDYLTSVTLYSFIKLVCEVLLCSSILEIFPF